MDDVIGVTVIAVQYALAIFSAKRYFGMELPREAVIRILAQARKR